MKSSLTYISEARERISSIPGIGFLVESDPRQLDLFPLFGGIVGVMSSLAVIVPYFMYGEKVTYAPLTLLYWRSVCDFGLGFHFILDPLLGKSKVGWLEHNCRGRAIMLQFFEITSEAWFLCVTIDLLTSINNPFSDFKDRRKYYHLFVWTCGLAYMLPLVPSNENLAGQSSLNDYQNNKHYHLCWLSLQDTHHGHPLAPWLMIFLPIVTVYMSSVLVGVLAYVRLRNGIPTTFIHRVRMLVLHSANIVVSLTYWTFLALITILVVSIPNDRIDVQKILYRLIIFLIPSKGFCSLIVYTIASRSHFQTKLDSERIDLNKALREEVMLYATNGIRKSVEFCKEVAEIEDYVSFQVPLAFSRDESFTFIFFLSLIVGSDKRVKFALEKMHQLKKSSSSVRRIDAGSGDADDGNPSVGTHKSIRMTRIKERAIARPNGSSYDIEKGTNGTADDAISSINRISVFAHDANPTSMYNVHGVLDSTAEFKHIARQTCLGSIGTALIKRLSCGLTEEVLFTEFAPYYFKRIRNAFHIKESEYMSAFNRTIKETVSEGGASGSFFFLSDGERFVAKSCKSEELNIIRTNAAAYSNYLIKNTNTYMTKIYGVYTLTLYGVNLHFFVMNNIFLNKEGLDVHEKYDIKGSWVNRNAKQPVEDQIVTCSHCQQKYVYQSLSARRKAQKHASINSNSSRSHGKTKSANTTFNPFNFNSSSLHDENHSISESVIDSTPLNNRRCSVTVNGVHEPSLTMKDNDLKFKVKISRQEGILLLSQLKKDVGFFQSIGIMDYSLLLGVHRAEYDTAVSKGACVTQLESGYSGKNANDVVADDKIRSASMIGNDRVSLMSDVSIQSSLGDINSVCSSSIFDFEGKDADVVNINGNNIGNTKLLYTSKIIGPNAYLMGIVDYQQTYTWRKQLERWAKIYIYGADGNGLSSIDPETYMDRFISKIEDLVDISA